MILCACFWYRSHQVMKLRWLWWASNFPGVWERDPQRAPPTGIRYNGQLSASPSSWGDCQLSGFPTPPHSSTLATPTMPQFLLPQSCPNLPTLLFALTLTLLPPPGRAREGQNRSFRKPGLAQETWIIEEQWHSRNYVGTAGAVWSVESVVYMFWLMPRS